MRTIKYRGKQNDTWLYGYVFEKAGEYITNISKDRKKNQRIKDLDF